MAQMCRSQCREVHISVGNTELLVAGVGVWCVSVCRAACKADVVAPITANHLIVRHVYKTNRAAMRVTVEGHDVMGVCVDRSLATFSHWCTAQTSITVTTDDCSYPVITIVDRAALFTSPRVSHRSSQLNIHAVVDIDCRTTLVNTKV